MIIKILRLITIPILGGLFLKSLIASYQQDFFLEFIFFWGISILMIIAFFWIVFEDIQIYMRKKKVISFLPTITGILVIVLIGNFYTKKENEIHAPSLIWAFYDGGYNGVSIDLKKNGNYYIIANGSGLGQRYHYGTYTLQDSLIMLDKNKIGKVISSKHLIIRSVKQNYHNALEEYENYIYQTNANGLSLESELRFRIITDDREGNLHR